MNRPSSNVMVLPSQAVLAPNVAMIISTPLPRTLCSLYRQHPPSG